jgi:UDP-N-acetylglucosamine--dolichyl-phosphate N-acetylglucosaminephosphotransferase
MASIFILPKLPLVLIALICGIVSFAATWFIMPHLIRRLKKANIVGKDIHKSLKPIVAEMGGLGILFGFVIGTFCGIYLYSTLTFQLIIVLLVILLVGIIGMVDDLIMLTSYEKLALLFFAGIPLIWAAPPNVGIFYIICIPIAVSICSNLTNMLAGLNGIESGLGVIAMVSLTISCIILGKYDVAIISMSMLGPLIAFLYFNKHPAKVFPGDTGTLVIGASIAAIAFIGRLKFIAFIILLPNIIDASLKFYSAGVMNRADQKPTQVASDGTLFSPDQGFKSLIRFVLRKPVTEKTAVKMIWFIGIMFGLAGIIIAILMPGVLNNHLMYQFMTFKDLFYHI